MTKRISLAMAIVCVLTCVQSVFAESKVRVAERVVIKFRPGSAAHQQEAVISARGHHTERHIPQLQMHAIRVPPGRTVEDVIARYENHPLVEYVEVETFSQPALTPNDPAFTYWQPQLKGLGAQAAWDITTGSPDVPIAVLDTGLDYNHWDFVGRNVTGYDFADRDPDYYDTHGHGTWVTGVIGAMTNNGQGLAGATWQNPIMVLRSAFGLDTIEAFTWATDNGARVISMSYGGYTPTSWQADALQYAFDRGVVLVGAAGNDGRDLTFYPAGYPIVLAVTGVDSYGEPVGYNYGDWIDLSAPASTMTTYHTAFDSDGLGQAGGSSISAPFVAAAAGLVLSANPALTPTQVMDILRDTADDVYEPGFDVMTGYGRVNYQAAVTLAANSTSKPDIIPPTATIAAPTPGAVLSGTTTIQVDATDNIRVTRVDLFLDGSFVSGDSTAPHEWPLDTATLADGQHTVLAVAYDAAGNSGESATVPVTVDNSAACDCPIDCDLVTANEVPGSTCDDAVDNDCDGLTDCDDPNCGSDAACAQPVPVVCNYNGVCEPGEDCENCPNDCFAGAAAFCGNGVCEAGNGEDCLSCPSDCNGKQGGVVKNQFCCGDGDGTNPVGTTDSRCSSDGFAFTEQIVADSCCGDGACAGTESGYDCQIDCGPPPVCGDGNCDADEDSCTCAADCGAPAASETLAATCSDGLDNDCDGQADGNDPDCASEPTDPSGDTTPPTISIQSPVNGAIITSPTVVEVSASDDVGVVKVELYVDGKLAGSSTDAPLFKIRWNPKKVSKGLHTMQCRAYDAAGNVGTSAAITIDTGGGDLSTTSSVDVKINRRNN